MSEVNNIKNLGAWIAQKNVRKKHNGKGNKMRVSKDLA